MNNLTQGKKNFKFQTNKETLNEKKEEGTLLQHSLKIMNMISSLLTIN